MVHGNILKQLKKDGYKVEPMQFDFIECSGVNGTALIDIENGEVKETTAQYTQVVRQIQANKSHIRTIEGKKKTLAPYTKLGY